jgi:hypothetical protein
MLLIRLHLRKKAGMISLRVFVPLLYMDFVVFDVPHDLGPSNVDALPWLADQGALKLLLRNCLLISYYYVAGQTAAEDSGRILCRK